MSKCPVHWLRQLALIEGLSFLILLFIAMPLKYLAGFPTPVKWVGWIHGILFTAFALLLAYVFFSRRWPFLRGVMVFAAALVPFGPFLIDRRLRDYAHHPNTPDNLPVGN
jgi:integral membrane protein